MKRNAARLDQPLRYVRAGEVELAVLDAGSGPALVFVHGWPQHSYCWRRVGALLADDHRVIAPDLRGFGDSPVVASGFDKKTLAGDVAALIETLDAAPCVVIGHDWGAPIAYRVAMDRPDVVHALVIINGRMPLVTRHNTLMYTPQQAAERWYFHFNRIPGLPERMIGANLRDFLDYLLVHWSAGRRVFSDEDLDELVRVHERPGGLAAGLGLYRTALDVDATDWLEHTGAVLDLPTLMLWGALDPVLPPVYLEGVDEVTPDVEIHVHDEAGHFLPEEAPRWCARHIANFIDRRLK
ncbi:MAG: alpha/beta hydrolase [Proteobacteria bacterium]|nr:MAG: alpha/beta hydrolase [Pseudomonadota bacterium]